MERLKRMKETLMDAVQAEMTDLKNADTEELGEAIDMIKDLAEAIYYCTVTKAMEECEKEEKERGKMASYFYHERVREPYSYHPERDMDRDEGRMYYPGDSSNMGGRSNSGGEGTSMASSRSGGNRSYYSEYPYRPHEENMSWERNRERDPREGRSPMMRKMYMESKSTTDKAKHMKDLEQYMQELNTDMMEMIQGASPEEKQLLHKKLSTLANKMQEII